MTMWTLLFLCSVIISHGVQGLSWTTRSSDRTTVELSEPTTDPGQTGATCGGYLYNTSDQFSSPAYPEKYPNNADCVWYINPGRQIVELQFTYVNTEGDFNCNYDVIYIYDGSSTYDRLLGKLCGGQRSTFHSTGYYMTVRFKSDSSSNYGGFQAEYSVVAGGSCRYNCGYRVGNCSCVNDCGYRGDCCPDYEMYGCGATTPEPTTEPSATEPSATEPSATEPSTTVTEDHTTDSASCRRYCGYNLGSCSCQSNCQYYGNCCHDYRDYCEATTAVTATPTAQPSCRYNCGRHLGSCSCASSCQYYGNCCYDYYSQCHTTTSPPRPTTARPSCRYNCGYNIGSCSCTSSCQYYGNCCYDYYSQCQTTTSPPRPTTARPSCRYNCGYNIGSCSCTSSCQYYGNCCYDYYSQCQATASSPPPTTAQPSCRYNCGYNIGSCSCTSSCQYYGNCCYDYNTHCQTTSSPPRPTTAQPSCRYNCGRHLGSCSCASSCQYYGNCCYDYYSHCQTTTAQPVPACGGSLSGSGSFSSPYYPNYYHDNAYCVWYLTAPYDQRIYLSITDLQMENCCNCDYINIYDGPLVSSSFLGKVCDSNNGTSNTFISSSNHMTVVFRSDSSVVGRGFNAEFTSTLSPSTGRVDCSSDNMNIVIDRSYLNSLGIDGYNLYLNDQYCRPQVSSNQVVFTFPINTCGTLRTFESGRVVYTNNVRAYTSSHGEITRQGSHFKLNVSCRMEQDTMVQIMYEVREDENSSIAGTGRFNGTMALYTSPNFYYQVTEVPYKVVLNQNMYVQVNLRRDDSSLVLFLDTCVASPSPHDFHSRYYDLVRNGCPRDNTYYAYVSGSQSYARFTFKAFQFLRTHQSVYVQCKVLICQASDYNSRCRRGCQNRKARDLGPAHESHTLVLGPIQLKDLEKQGEGKEEVKAEVEA